ncbi:GLPGLI family protein [Chryseobacterium sp. SSA4.19]|uniref:GLPGLI family protein n=1 Tax=Chryseobacterium sp. SSA4.19 TaxID=2919915 RepID=UPI001F4E6274|nr:GLPGLI family protein [Chryseobacterium sp. SSA4.19]MCJ8154771.1 GLPGLI family protein [Chryseobacterium sp. SSA4.19]
MKKILQTALTVIVILINGQSTATRFFYELTYKPNKDSAKLEKEMMVLDIDQNRSLYQSYKNIQIDSIASVMIKESSNTGFPDFKKIGNRRTQFTHQISKRYPIREVLYKDHISMDYYSYRENPELVWKISDEKQKIGTYNAQKAIADFAGRKWIAWFTTEIPFPDGPYKFYGLPGLIVKVGDEAGNYSWELKGNGKIDQIAEASFVEGLMSKTGLFVSKEITKEKFTEKYEQYKKDPLAGMKQMLGQIPSDVKLSDEFSLSKEMRAAEKQMKENLARNNNSIELPGRNK